MVRVRRGKRGHRQSRSLVFRISRTSKPISDDSGVKCNSTDKETSNLCEQTPVRELKIRIPKCVLQDTSTKEETGAIKCGSPGHQMLRKSDPPKVTTSEDALRPEVDVPNDSVDDRNLNEVDLRSNRNLSCNSGFLGDASKETLTRMSDTKSSELRRSSRRIVLRVQKEPRPNYSIKEPSNVSHKFPFGSSNSSEQQVYLGEKRKRGRKPAGARGVLECKKRKYGRRGRPPKSSFPEKLSLVKPVATSGGSPKEKLVLVAPPKNSVWTLVPKELFESEFFKSQLLQVRLPNSSSSEEGARRNLVPVSFSSPLLSGGPKPDRIPAPTPHEKEEKDPKRPTVIYFKTERKKFDSSRDQRRDFRNPQPLFPSQTSKTESDMLYLFNKYRMLEDIILKNYYELAGGNLNEAENLLSNLLSKTSDNSQVYDVSLGVQASRPAVDPTPPSPDPPSDDPPRGTAFPDTLSRDLIVQSLRILYSDEAVSG